MDSLPPLVLDLPPQPYKVEQLYAAVAVQADGEGIVAVLTDTGWMPMVFTDPGKLRQFKVMIERMASEAPGVKVVVRTFIQVNEESL